MGGKPRKGTRKDMRLAANRRTAKRGSAMRGGGKVKRK